VFTGSSKVFIGGARARRSLAHHVPLQAGDAGGCRARGTASAMQTAMKAAMKAAPPRRRR
jgi:hypothetical protein